MYIINNIYIYKVILKKINYTFKAEIKACNSEISKFFSSKKCDCYSYYNLYNDLAATLKTITLDNNSFSLNDTNGCSNAGLLNVEGTEANLVVIVKAVIKLLLFFLFKN